MSDLAHAIGAIEHRIQLVRLTEDCAEFLTRTRRWVEIMATGSGPVPGWRIRVYYRGHIIERSAPDVIAALDIARELSRAGYTDGR